MKKILTTTALVAAMTAGAAQAQQTWNLQSTYPGSLTQLGTLGIRIAEQITRITGGEITVTFQNPGGVVPALEVFDAVGSGAVEAGWSTPGYWAGLPTFMVEVLIVTVMGSISVVMVWVLPYGGFSQTHP